MGRAAWVAAVAGLAVAVAGFGCRTTDGIAIEPEANDALRQMSDLLAGTPSFRLHSTGTIEERLESGQVAQFRRDADILVRRPDRLAAHVRRGPDAYRVWYQGKTLTILDERRYVYAVVETPDRIDEMLDFMAEEYGLVFPMADLLYPDPYEVLTEQVTSGTYVDEQEIGEHRCHHLLFTQDMVDWQIWIDAGGVPVPRRVVITYNDDPDAPQFDGVLDEWQRVDTGEKDFAPTLPKDARQVEIDELRFGE